jgi:hypothetical protein
VYISYFTFEPSVARRVSALGIIEVDRYNVASWKSDEALAETIRCHIGCWAKNSYIANI